eukprot:1527674-Rhodomonas_salina.1
MLCSQSPILEVPVAHRIIGGVRETLQCSLAKLGGVEIDTRVLVDGDDGVQQEEGAGQGDAEVAGAGVAGEAGMERLAGMGEQGAGEAGVREAGEGEGCMGAELAAAVTAGVAAGASERINTPHWSALLECHLVDMEYITPAHESKLI